MKQKSKKKSAKSVKIIWTEAIGKQGRKKITYKTAEVNGVKDRFGLWTICEWMNMYGFIDNKTGDQWYIMKETADSRIEEIIRKEK